MIDDLFVILRTAKERSYPLAKKALSLQTSKYAVIEEYPFFDALKKMFATGKERSEKYLLALDADVVLHPGSLESIVEIANEHLAKSPALFFLDFFVMDKFRGKCCSGCHLYVNQYSKDLHAHLVSNSDDTRPENQLILDFAKTHHMTHEKSHFIVGLHDFEQYYRDLYAKYFRRARRRRHEAEMLIHILEERQKYYSKDDQDFAVALKALHDGLNTTASNKSLFDARLYQKIEEILPLKEKNALFT